VVLKCGIRVGAVGQCSNREWATMCVALWVTVAIFYGELDERTTRGNADLSDSSERRNIRDKTQRNQVKIELQISNRDELNKEGEQEMTS